jgi:DNA-binding GntR family transcriptional regulator
MTVQHAPAVLRDEGLVVGQQGRGIFVQTPIPDTVTPPAAQRQPNAAPASGQETAAGTEPLIDRLDRPDASSIPPSRPVPTSTTS